ncbi:MAG TPA: glycosyltransferase family 2 protein [Thermodesulfobacteriota bacterium]|nr:glycosyltransferase family 2 protein [Thermodesulfobacteriota bacterium]
MNRIPVCAVIPAYNAETSLGNVIDRTREHVHRVIVVNDGSTDSTEDVARGRGVEVVSLSSNKGKGYALRRGFSQALTNGCRAVVTLDADGQHDPEDIPNFLGAHESDCQAILIGTRMAQADRFPRQRYYSNRTAAFFISKALGQYLEDTQCGFRLYPAESLRAIPLTTSRFQTETEVLLRAVQRGIRLSSVPVKNIYPNGNSPHSNFRPVTDTFHICMVVLRSYLKIL